MKATKTLRVRVTLVIEVDREAYEAEYGEAFTAAEIRDHVVGVAVNATESAFENISAVRVEGSR